MDALKVNTPEALHQAIGEFLQSDYSRENLIMVYDDARYKKDYKITKEQLEYLAQRIKKLHEVTEKSCKDKIESFIQKE